MADIFLSYSHDDLVMAGAVAKSFELTGMSVFFDQAILVGESWNERIAREIDASQVVVVLWSPASVISKWVNREAREGASRGVLFPGMIETCRLPLEFSDVQFADLRDWQPDAQAHPGWSRLLSGVRASLQRAHVSPVNVQPAADPLPPNAEASQLQSTERLRFAYGEQMTSDELFERLGLSAARRAGSNYQASREVVDGKFRWWATQFQHGNGQFGVQRVPMKPFGAAWAAEFAKLGFQARSDRHGNINEMVISIEGTVEQKTATANEAMEKARIVSKAL